MPAGVPDDSYGVKARGNGRRRVEDPASDDARRLSRAALWFLQYLAGRVDGIAFSAKDIARQLRSHGYEEVSDQVVIPEITRLVVCARPSS